MSRPEVSVVIPTRDRWPVLQTAALRASLLQANVAHEVIIVDDGSVDGTSAHLDALADERVRVVRHEQSLGVAKARKRRHLRCPRNVDRIAR